MGRIASEIYTMKIINCKQGSTEWLAARSGIPTASEFDAIITPEWKQRTGQSVETYLYRKLAEKYMGFPMQTGGGGGGSWAMDQGTLLETVAIPWFVFTNETPVERVGFITTDDGRIGCSPDGLIGSDGGIEIKCPQPDTHIKYFLRGEVPKEYLAQVHGSMFVTGRKWWYFLSYNKDIPPLLIRVERDEKIMAAIKSALDSFLEQFDAKFAVLKKIRDDENAEKTAEYYRKEGIAQP